MLYDLKYPPHHNDTTDIYIFEFKLDGSALAALQQIEDRQYALPYLNDSRRLHKIGVNISSETRTVAEWKMQD